MSKLTRYTGRAVRMSVPQYRRYRAAMAIGKYAWRHRSQIARAAKRVRTSYRRRKKAKFSTKNVGEPVGSSNCKRAETLYEEFNVNRSTRILNTRTLLNIYKQDSFNDNLDKRVRDIINVRGIKICGEWKNNSSYPLYLNVAVISPKDGVVNVSADDFFRSHSADKRSVNFSTALSSNQLHCLPVNSDKYTVLRHKRFTLGPDPTPLNNRPYSINKDNFLVMNWYLKLKRQIRFEGDLNVPESGQVYLVWWADKFGTDATTAPAPDSYNNSLRAIVYFKETHSF